MNRALSSSPSPSWQPMPQNVPFENDPLSIAEETKAPLQKKPKINEEEEKVDSDDEIMLYSDEENDKSSPIKPTYSVYDSEEDCYNGNYDKELWKRYRQQVKESQGFDIVDYPGQCPMTTVFPMPNYLNNTNNYNTLKDYAGKALKIYNDKEGTSYEVDNILKVNGGGCRDFHFYITFSVKNGEHSYFQAKVVECIDNHLEFPTVRPKKEAAVVE